MRAFLLRRVGLAVFQLFVVGTLVFLLVRLIPGDPARIALGENATAEQVNRVHALMHLDEPLLAQYAGFWGRLLTGDLGRSLISGREVVQDLPLRLGNSLELVVLALLLALLVGILLGRWSALRRDRLADHAITAGSILALSAPVFVVGTLLLLLFSVYWTVLPPERFVAFFEDPVAHLRLLVLPVVTLALNSAAVVARMTRTAMIETMGSDFVRTARAKGLYPSQVINRHVLRTSLLPVINVTSVELATLIGGTVLVETIFGWPGLSSLLISSVSLRDYPVIQAVVLATALVVVLINLVADLVGRLVDPRAEVS